MKKTAISILILIIALLVVVLPTRAQEGSELSLRLRKDFGFAAGSRMQGTFSLSATGPEDLQRVVFYVDGQPLGEDSEAPFSLRFVTDKYAIGAHTLSATGLTTSGLELRSNEINAEFVSAQEGAEVGFKLGGVIFGIVLVVMLLSFIGPMLIGRGKVTQLPPGTLRKYGFAGGTICPNCKRPYAMHMMAPNIVVGKLDRCPYCGKVSVARRYPMEMLRAAEAAELEMAQAGGTVPEMSEEEKLRKELESSRYQDL